MCFGVHDFDPAVQHTVNRVLAAAADDGTLHRNFMGYAIHGDCQLLRTGSRQRHRCRTCAIRTIRPDHQAGHRQICGLNEPGTRRIIIAFELRSYSEAERSRP